MVSSLKDALLQAGLKPAPKPEADTRPRSEQNRPSGGRARQFGKGRPGAPGKSPAPGRPGSAGKPAQPGKPKRIDPQALVDAEQVSLAAAYKARQQAEQRELAQAKREREAAAAAKRARQAAAEKLLEGQSLNVADAEDSRYFEYGRKIRRLYVTPEQNQALTEGQLGIVQMKGRFHLVSAVIALAIREAAPEYFALLLEGEAQVRDEEDQRMD
ncbi:MAG: DUF2058 family protein [Lysobacterales bacterium]